MFYKDKVVLVTGGANGIGKAISYEYGKKGAIVIMADKDKVAGEKIKEEFEGENLRGDFYNIDLSNPREVDNMFKLIIKTYGKINVLINNAGISKFKSMFDLSLDEWDEIINVNLRSVFLTSRNFAKYNKACKYGRIVNISSTRHIMSEPNSEAYAASKGGIVSLTHALAISLKNENITVNCISPGWIENHSYESLSNEDHVQHPSGRVGRPEDISRVCLFLTDENNDFINGQNITVDGGMTKKMIYLE